VLPSAGFSDDPRLAHAHGEQDLADAIIDLVRAGVIELVALEPYLRASELFGDARGEVERAGPADVMLEQILELFCEGRISLGRTVSRFQLKDQRHQRFGDIAPTELAEMATIIRLSAEGVGESHAVPIAVGVARSRGSGCSGGRSRRRSNQPLVIARGSGVEPADVNRVLKARDAMQKLAKQFGAVNRKGKAAGLPRLFGKGGASW